MATTLLCFCELVGVRQFCMSKVNCTATKLLFVFALTDKCLRMEKSMSLVYMTGKVACVYSCKIAADFLSCKDERVFCRCNVDFVAAKLPHVFTAAKIKLSLQSTQCQMQICVAFARVPTQGQNFTVSLLGMWQGPAVTHVAGAGSNTCGRGRQ